MKIPKLDFFNSSLPSQQDGGNSDLDYLKSIELLLDENWIHNKLKEKNIQLYEAKNSIELIDYCIEQKISFSPIFDIEFYSNQQGLPPDKAIEHYLTEGFKKYNNPNYLFDSNYYLLKNKDVAKAGINPIAHFIKYGWKEKRNPHPLFDLDYYTRLYPDIDNGKINPYFHYLNFGFKENRDPHPLFSSSYVKKKYNLDITQDALKHYLDKSNDFNSTHDLFNPEFLFSNSNLTPRDNESPLETFMSSDPDLQLVTTEKFDPKYYVEENGLNIDIHPIIHYVKFGKEEGRQSAIYLSPEIKQQILAARDLEPRVVRTHKNYYDLYQFSLPPVYSNEYILLKRCLENISQKPDLIFLLSTMRRGGAEIFALKIMQSVLRNSNEKILLILTDQADCEAAEWIPKNTNLECLNFQEFEPSTSFEQRQNILNHIISFLKPKNIMNVNSWVGWELYKNYGIGLSKSTLLDTCLFCYDYDKNFRKSGYAPQYFRECIPWMNAVVTDNYSFKNDLIDDFGLHGKLADMIKVLHQHADFALPKINQESLLDRIENNFFNDRPKVLWASRMAYQKRPDLLIQIADRIPSVEFYVWGGNINKFLEPGQELPENIIVKGTFEKLADIPYYTYDMFIHTCSWDGLPTMVLDMVNVGLPVIAPDVGGIPDLVSEKTGWLIQDNEDVESYTKAIKEVISDSVRVREKLEAAQALLKELHSYAAFDSSIKQELSYE